MEEPFSVPPFKPLERQASPAWLSPEEVLLDLSTGDRQTYKVKKIDTGTNRITIALGDDGKGLEQVIDVSESFIMKRPPYSI